MVTAYVSMSIKRLFSTDSVKGCKNYLDTQKKYEIIRTIIYFGISLSLLAAGWITTGERTNLLTIVAILGCLPASKSLVGAIMFCRSKSLSSEDADKIEKNTEGLTCLYDLIFTTREKTYPVLHMVVCGNTIVGYMPADKDKTKTKKLLDEKVCEDHLVTCLKVDNFKDVTVKIFRDVSKYTNRLVQIQELQTDETYTTGICNTLKSIAL